MAFARVVLVQSNREIKVFTNNLKLKSDIEQTGGSISASDLIIDKSKACAYNAGDMIAYKNNMNVGIVLQIDAMGGISGDFIRIINDQGQVVNIKSAEISKKFDPREMRSAKASAIDSKRNTIY